MAPSPSLPRDRTKLTSTEFDLPRLDNDAHETEICLPIVNDIIIPILKTEVARKAMPRKRRVLKNDGLLPTRMCAREKNEWIISLWSCGRPSSTAVRIVLDWHNWLRHWIGETWPKMSDVNRFGCQINTLCMTLAGSEVNLISRR